MNNSNNSSCGSESDQSISLCLTRVSGQHVFQHDCPEGGSSVRIAVNQVASPQLFEATAFISPAHNPADQNPDTLGTDHIPPQQLLESPIGSLPAEILQNIFHILASVAPNQSRDIRWTVSHVSRFWRACAVAYQSLWSSLPLIRLPNLYHRNHIIPILTAFLDRSGIAPLIVNIEVNDCRDRSDHPIFSLLAKHSQRWKKLVLKASPNTLLGLSGQLKNQISRLESLKLTIDGSVSLPIPKVDIFKNAPSLREAHVQVFGCVGYIDLPYPQLNSFVADRHLHRSDFSASAEATVQMTPVLILPFMTKLELSWLKLEDEAGFKSLTLPALQQIDIRKCEIRVFQSLATIISHSPTPCNLRLLSVFDSSALNSPGDLPTLLALTPALETLYVEATFVEDVVAMGSFQLGGSVLVPRLTSCCLSLSRPPSAMYRAISQLATFRCRKDPGQMLRLQALRVNSKYSTSYQTFRGLSWEPIDMPNLHQARLEPWSIEEIGESLTEITAMEDFNLRLNKDNAQMFAWKTQPLLDEIKQYHVSDPKDIIRSNVHHSLKKIQVKGAGSSQIDEIFLKWEAPFISMLDNLHWVYQNTSSDPKSMLYIHDSHPIRASPKKAANLFMKGFSKIDVDALSASYIPDRPWIHIGDDDWGV